jgi:hypothetical protein
MEMRKGRASGDAGDRVLVRSTPPDLLNRTLDRVVQRRVLGFGDRVLFVDDWAETAATAQTAHRIIEARQRDLDRCGGDRRCTSGQSSPWGAGNAIFTTFETLTRFNRPM